MRFAEITATIFMEEY